MIFETSWDDWCVENRRLADLLSKYNIPATFYIEADRLNDWKSRDEVFYLKSKFEIGCHSYNHPSDMKTLDLPSLFYQTKTAKDDMEGVLGRSVKSFCYPRGRYNDEVVKAVKQAGFGDARTTEVLRIDRIWDEHRKPTTIHFYPRNEYQEVDILFIAKQYFDRALEQDGYYHLWGHAWEIEKLGLWTELEYLLKYIHERISVARAS